MGCFCSLYSHRLFGVSVFLKHPLILRQLNSVLRGAVPLGTASLTAALLDSWQPPRCFLRSRSSMGTSRSLSYVEIHQCRPTLLLLLLSLSLLSRARGKYGTFNHEAHIDAARGGRLAQRCRLHRAGMPWGRAPHALASKHPQVTKNLA